MSKVLPDFVVEMTNIVAKRNISLTSIEVDSILKGAKTGMNFAIAWIEEGESSENLSATINLLISIADISEPELGKVLKNANMFMVRPDKKFSQDMFEGVSYRRNEKYSERYREGIVKGFLHCMDTFDELKLSPSQNKVKIVVGHLAVVKAEIHDLLSLNVGG